jgi:hypothetical protein
MQLTRGAIKLNEIEPGAPTAPVRPCMIQMLDFIAQ